MSAIDDPEDLGRTRLSFASEADIDEFVEHARARSSSGELGPDQWRGVPPGARHLRPAPGRRADAAREDSAGRAHRRAARRRSRTWPSATRAASATSRRGRTSSSTSSSCTTSSRRCEHLADAGLTTREACGNSVRNITACPYAGVVGRRGLRRHAVRRGADALLPAPSALVVAAAQVQDRLRGLPRGPRVRGDQRHRLARARRARTAAARASASPSAAARDDVAAGRALFDFLPAARC